MWNIDDKRTQLPLFLARGPEVIVDAIEAILRRYLSCGYGIDSAIITPKMAPEPDAQPMETVAMFPVLVGGVMVHVRLESPADSANLRVTPSIGVPVFRCKRQACDCAEHVAYAVGYRMAPRSGSVTIN